MKTFSIFPRRTCLWLGGTILAVGLVTGCQSYQPDPSVVPEFPKEPAPPPKPNAGWSQPTAGLQASLR